jgi:hypothetical protein
MVIVIIVSVFSAFVILGMSDDNNRTEDKENSKDSSSEGNVLLTDQVFNAPLLVALPDNGRITWGNDFDIEAYFNSSSGSLELYGSLQTESYNEVRVSTMFNSPTSKTSGIQEAVNDLPYTGGTVFIPPGNHYISTTIDLSDRSQIMLFGAGWDSTVINTNTNGEHTLQKVGGSRLVIKDLRITGNSYSGDGIHLSLVDTFLIQNVYVHENGNYGIYIEGSGELADPMINACYVIQNGNDGVYSPYGVHDFLVTSCHIEENNGNGIHFRDGFDLTVVGTNVEDHTVGCEILVDGGYSTVITGNTLETYGGTAVIKFMNECQRVIITGNTIESDGDGTGIWVSDGVYEKGVVISSNNFWRIGACIDIDNVPINGTIIGNVFSDYVTTILNEGTNVEVAHNVG